MGRPDGAARRPAARHHRPRAHLGRRGPGARRAVARRGARPAGARRFRTGARRRLLEHRARRRSRRPRGDPRARTPARRGTIDGRPRRHRVRRHASGQRRPAGGGGHRAGHRPRRDEPGRSGDGGRAGALRLDRRGRCVDPCRQPALPRGPPAPSGRPCRTPAPRRRIRLEVRSRAARGGPAGAPATGRRPLAALEVDRLPDAPRAGRGVRHPEPRDRRAHGGDAAASAAGRGVRRGTHGARDQPDAFLGLLTGFLDEG